jgi:GntR family transcriptional regulator, rspAB operon transcriptional repressor
VPGQMQTERDAARGRLTAEAYRYVRSAILRGEFPMGSVLAETELARTLGSSRTPIRHALSLLLKEGLLEVGPRRQLIVRGFTSDHRREIALCREALEVIAVRHACSVVSDDDLDQLRLLVLRQRRAAAASDHDAFLELDESFHLKIAEAANLPIVYGLLSQLRGFVRVARPDFERPATVLAEVAVEHDSIIDALELRDAEAAVDALLGHLNKKDYAESRS